ncbi:saccharopine dehydrogenase NADP-binding domain-containing protein, partial [Arthrospira platensis SPKY1]|nr:saccharopine dehydrogenase NADP-binding domain-containing protein [Arthrospira platensis SPKY1]
LGSSTSFYLDMKHILVFGAGLSSGDLIGYLAQQGHQHNWQLTLCDLNEANLARFAHLAPHVQGAVLDTTDAEAVSAAVAKADVVISMLPAFMHPKIAKPCLQHGKSLFTASYVSDEIQAMHTEAA